MRLQFPVDDGERGKVLRKLGVGLAVSLVNVAVVHRHRLRAAARIAPIIAARQHPQLLGVRPVEVYIQDVLSMASRNCSTKCHERSRTIAQRGKSVRVLATVTQQSAILAATVPCMWLHCSPQLVA